MTTPENQPAGIGREQGNSAGGSTGGNEQNGNRPEALPNNNESELPPLVEGGLTNGLHHPELPHQPEHDYTWIQERLETPEQAQDTGIGIQFQLFVRGQAVGVNTSLAPINEESPEDSSEDESEPER